MQLNIKYDDNSLLILPYAHYKGNIFLNKHTSMLMKNKTI